MDKLVEVRVYHKDNVKKTRWEIYKDFEKDYLKTIRDLVKMRVIKRLFFKILPVLEERLTRPQLSRVLCDFEINENSGFEDLYVKKELREMLNQSVETIVERIMVEAKKEFKKCYLINIIEQIFTRQPNE